MAAPSINTELRTVYLAEQAAIQKEFANSASGPRAVSQRCKLIDAIIRRLWQEHVCRQDEESDTAALVAIGGYGRQLLFPHSDIDVLFLFRAEPDKHLRERIAAFSQELWDLKLRLSPQHRTLAQCDRFDSGNIEFTIAALDSRHVAGNTELSERLRNSFIPRLVMRNAQQIVHELGAVTRARHARFANTIFHLEPNVKEGPGGLRDYNVVHWLALLSAVEARRNGQEPQSSLIEPSIRSQFDEALEYLFSVRCFLHFRQGRDDNLLNWEAQAEAAERGIGYKSSESLRTEEWMRTFFRHARAIHRAASQLIEELPAARSSFLYRDLQNWHARISNSNFSVVNGFILLQQPGGAKDSELLLQMFLLMARQGVKMSRSTEQRIEQSVTYLASHPPGGALVWKYFREILLSPYAADALRAMHFLGVLNVFVPEMQAIDSLVLRDYYHRFTVDEHSFRAIESLHRLKDTQSQWEYQYRDLFSELEQPELLFLALLLHDVGKGSNESDHARASVDVARTCMTRLLMSDAEQGTVLFLIANHLELSKTLRRDIFDQETIRAFADRVGIPERLKMLALMTYADIRSVNLEALTPWKAENIWQLYIATANFLNRHADSTRVHATPADHLVKRVQSLAGGETNDVAAFLEGLPQRYLATCSPEAVLHHCRLASQLNVHPVQLGLKQGAHCFELTLVSRDRPGLFARIAGVLSAWGMNIIKANAFSNAAGVVVDTFHFSDSFRTLELNSEERDRFLRSIAGVLGGEVELERLLQARFRSVKPEVAKVNVESRIECSNEFSPNSTVLEIVTRDRPRLLYDLSRAISDHCTNIEIALIDTEGQVVIDVFYLTHRGLKLNEDQQIALVQAVRAELGSQMGN